MSKKKLIKARLAKGMSQEELADLIGMTQSNYSRRENGLKKISENEWKKIAKELGVEKDIIFESDDEIIEMKNSINMHQINIPDFVIDHIELLKRENIALKENLKKLKD